jgi:hypothetical protein
MQYGVKIRARYFAVSGVFHDSVVDLKFGLQLAMLPADT